MQKSEREAGREREAVRNKCHEAKRPGRSLLQIPANHARTAGQADVLKVTHVFSLSPQSIN